MDEPKLLIEKISSMRNSNVICYIAGDRQNVSTRIAPDIIPVFYQHLENLKAMNDKKPIDLLLFTKGGDVLTAHRLVHLIYEYTDTFSVLIPFKAYSAGTLISLGASEILMTKMAELSPVDPNVSGVFNPEDPNNPSAKIPISVEDVYAFITIAKDIMGIVDDKALAQIFTQLAEKIHPLSLGTIQRTYLLIRSIADKLLRLHRRDVDEERITNTINHLTEQLFSHNYMITRKEAKEIIDLPIRYPQDDLEDAMWKYYKYYESYLDLEMPFQPENYIDMNGNFSVCSGIIETLHQKDGYVFEGIVKRQLTNEQNVTNDVNITFQGWKSI